MFSLVVSVYDFVNLKIQPAAQVLGGAQLLDHRGMICIYAYVRLC
jgi:hypothetical protein